jgi:hypothetical protein
MDLTLYLVIAWIGLVALAYRAEFRTAWRSAYPDGFGKNYPSRNCSVCSKKYIEKNDSWIWISRSKCDECKG